MMPRQVPVPENQAVPPVTIRDLPRTPEEPQLSKETLERMIAHKRCIEKVERWRRQSGFPPSQPATRI